MDKTRINNRQMGFMLFIMRSTIIIAFLPVLTSADALQDAWASAFVILISSLVITAAVAGLSQRFPQQTIVDYSQKLCGNWLGKLLGLIFLWLFLQMSVIEVRIYGEVITTNFMTRTPLTFVVGIIILSSAICVYQGIEILGRMADVLFIIFLLMVIIVLILPLTTFEGTNLQPVLARGWGPVIRGSLVPIALIAQVWVIGVLTPNLLKPERVVYTSLLAIGFSLFTLILIVVVVVGVLGAFEGSRAVFPLFYMIRSIEISEFLQRTELLIIFAWGMGIFISASTYLYAGAVSVARFFGLKSYSSLVWPMSISWILLTTTGFESMFEVHKFLMSEIYVPYGMTILLGPLILLWLVYGLRKIGKEKEDNK